MATLYNLSKAFVKLALKKTLNKRFPLNVFIAVTNKCNLKCDYCYGEYYNRKNFREFTTDELIDILKTIKKMGCIFLRLQGGEPLLRKDIKILVETAKSLNLNTDLLTNAILIPKHIDTIKMLDSICISLDGSKFINDKNRGTDTFEKIVEGIDICKSEKIPTRINAVITNDTTIDDINFLMEFVKSKNILLNFCPSFKFKPLTENKNYDYFNYDTEKYFKLLDIIIDYKKKDYPIQFSINAYKIAKEWSLPLEKIRVSKNKLSENLNFPKCYHGDYVCFIDSDGRLYPCCNFWNDYVDINVHELGFEKAFQKLTRLNCQACYIYSYIDRNLLLNFNFSTLLNYIKIKKFDLK